MWGVEQKSIVETAERIFKEFKHYQSESDHSNKRILHLEIQYLLNSKFDRVLFLSNQPEPTIYFGLLGQYIEDMAKEKKGVIYISKNYIFGQCGLKEMVDTDKLLQLLKQENPNASYKKHVTKLSFKVEKK